MLSFCTKYFLTLLFLLVSHTIFSQEIIFLGGIANDTYLNTKGGSLQLEGGYPVIKKLNIGVFGNFGYKFGKNDDLNLHPSEQQQRLDINFGIYKEFIIADKSKLRVQGGVGYGKMLDLEADINVSSISPFVAIGYYLKLTNKTMIGISYGIRGNELVYDNFNFGFIYSFKKNHQEIKD